MPEKHLIQKLADVMASIKHVPKRGRNDFHKYDYATEADIAEAVRDALANRGIMMIPSVQSVSWREVQGKNGPQSIVTLMVKFTITDGEHSIEFNAVGEGQDTGDKNTYKAITGATKYALLKLFLIPTGDDPEQDERHDRQQQRKLTTKPPNAPSGGIRAPTYEVISEAQRKKLFATAKDNGLSHEALKARISAIIGVESTKDVPASRFDELLRAIQSNGSAPEVEGASA